MIAVLKEKFDDIEAQRKQLFRELEEYNDEQLNFKPSENEWSILEVMHHLIMAESGSAMYVQKKLMSGLADIPDVGEGNAAGYQQLVDFMLHNTTKAPAPPMVTPTFSRASFAETREAWNKARQATADQLDRFGEADLNKATYKHFVAGRLNIEQMLGFFDVHFRRHLGQIERIKSAIPAR